MSDDSNCDNVKVNFESNGQTIEKSVTFDVTTTAVRVVENVAETRYYPSAIYNHSVAFEPGIISFVNVRRLLMFYSVFRCQRFVTPI